MKTLSIECSRILTSIFGSILISSPFIFLLFYIDIEQTVGVELEIPKSEQFTPQKHEKQKVVKLMQRQQKKPTSGPQSFRSTAISDFGVNDFTHLDVKDLSPVVNAANPSRDTLGATANTEGKKEGLLENAQMKQARKGVPMTLPETMQQRCGTGKRMARLRSAGGKNITELAIIRGLDWLKANQDSEGSWGGKDRDDEGIAKPSDKNAMTGMALLAFLGHCELQNSPKYGPTIQKAIKFLTSSSPQPKIISGVGAYSHPIRTYAICEAYTMTKIYGLEVYVKKATNHIIKGQNQNGGWAYGYGKGVAAHTDLSVTGWHIQALKAAYLTGIKFEGLEKAMGKAIDYVKQCQDQSGKFAYKRGSGGKPSLTGTGVLCLQMWKNAESEEAKKGLEWIIANQAKEWKRVNVYEWYYHAQACFQATGVSGGERFWRAWNKDFQQILCGAQDPDGHWPHGAHYHGDTDIYRTCMTILMLEVFYRYMPTNKT